MPKHSAGILLYRRHGQELEVFLVHPGGPFWMKKDGGAWSIPKGEYAPGEDPLAAAQREFEEETGTRLDGGTFIPLGEIKQTGGKIVAAWAIEGDCNAASIRSNTFSLEWPPKSGKIAEFPEVDRAGWLDLAAAREKLLKGQLEFLDRLTNALAEDRSEIQP
jgi:predicted NUDIX family NTP pyrophosphohydrolase